MFSTYLCNVLIKCRITNQKYIFRYVRGIGRRGDKVKFLEGNIKTITQYDDEFNDIRTYKELVKSVEKSKLGDQLEIERNFLDEDYHGHVFEKCDRYYEAHLSEEDSLKSLIKKQIIERKYFKFGRETNLLTHAAKQQIRFLHNSDPLEWNYKALSECFPISEMGVKKLLKCSFISTWSPEQIKTHDEDVARKWKILKSGEYSEEITPLTQKLYKEGKLVDDYFSGNPNLPTAPPSRKVIELKKNVKVGEFAAIVKTYSDYEEKKKLLESEENTEKQVAVRDINFAKSLNNKNPHAKKASRLKVFSEEYDSRYSNPEVCPSVKKERINDDDIPFSQFKELLKEKNEAKLKSKSKNEYNSYVQEQISKTDKNFVPEKEVDSENCFVKIPKFEKENVDLMFEKDQKLKRIYKYDEKLGYQYPSGKTIKGKINVSPKHYKKGKLIKVGKNIYDEEGEFLCRVP